MGTKLNGARVTSNKKSNKKLLINYHHKFYGQQQKWTKTLLLMK